MENNKNIYEEFCKSISNQEDSWISMKGINGGKPYYIVTEEYFKKISDVYEKDSERYFKNILLIAQNNIQEIQNLIKDMEVKIKTI